LLKKRKKRKNRRNETKMPVIGKKIGKRNRKPRKRNSL